MRSIYPILVLLILSLYGCSKPASPNLSRPASIDEISKSVFTINYNGIPHGKGVLVGLNNEIGNEKVFFLTARHVATYGSIANTQLDICFGEKGNIAINTKTDRWYTAPKEFDMAWFELSPVEKVRFSKKNLLNYIPLHRCGQKGSWTQALQKYAKENPNGVVNAKMFYRDGIIDGEICMQDFGIAPLPFPHNQRLKKCDILVFLAKVPKICTPGDSGGATFIQCRVDGKEYWLLCGIVAGGDTERQVNAIQPIDEVIRTIRFDSRRLIDFPEYW